MFPDDKKMCHRTAFEKPCLELVSSKKCQDRWKHLIVRNTQTGVESEFYGCIEDQSRDIQMAIETRLLSVQAAIEARGDRTAQMIAEGIMRQELQHKEALSLTRPASVAMMLEDTQMSLLSYDPKNGSHG